MALLETKFLLFGTITILLFVKQIPFRLVSLIVMADSTKALEGTRLHQLLSEDETRLLDTIDELRSQGVGRLLGDAGLPQLIVCGDQSSGKSSVLEALTRVRFPTKSSVCTTFATELRLRREPKSHISCRIKAATSRSSEEKERLARFQSSFDSPEDFPELIAAARNCMNLGEKVDTVKFFDDILEVEITGPKLAPLTVVDLPGLIHYSGTSGNKDVEKVSNLVQSYMRQSNSLVLAIISAHNDINNQIVLKHVKSIVPDGSRTLGIITKPDQLPSGSEKEDEYLDLARSNPDKFHYGWHVVRNRAYEEQTKSFDERDDTEKDFFRTSNWAPLESRGVGLGIDTLRKKLSKMLLDHIALSLPSILENLEQDLDHSQNQLNKFGAARQTIEEQQKYISEISDEFGVYVRDALDGRYHSTSFFGDPLSIEGLERRLRAAIRNLNDDFADQMLKYGHKWNIVDDSEMKSNVFGQPPNFDHPFTRSRSDFIKYHVDKLARHERGNELPGIPNPLLVGSLFRQQSEPWERIAADHLEAVWRTVKKFLDLLLGHLTSDRTCNQLLVHIIDPAMEIRRRESKQKLKELLIPHQRSDPINIDPRFAHRVWSQRERRITKSILNTVQSEFKVKTSTDPFPSTDEVMAKIETTNMLVDDQHGSSETLESMQAYYEVFELLIYHYAVIFNLYRRPSLDSLTMLRHSPWNNACCLGSRRYSHLLQFVI